MENREDTFVGEEDGRYRQCNKEMWLTVAFFFVNMLVVGIPAVVLGYGTPAEEVRTIAGLPNWYWYGGVLGSIVLTILAVLMIKLFYKEMPLESTEEDEQQ